MTGVGGTGNHRGDRGIMLMGGTLNLHGNRTNSWSKLSKTAEAGGSSIEVLNAAGWRVNGHMIALASTDFNPHQAERRTIAAIRSNTITLDEKSGLHALRQESPSAAWMNAAKSACCRAISSSRLRLTRPQRSLAATLWR